MPRRFTAAFVAALACSGEPIGPDAGSDAAQRDAPRDAPRDVAADGADGASRQDAGTDPLWVRLPDQSDACFTERATHPERVVRIRFDPCPVGLPSCTMAVLEPAWPEEVTFSGDWSRWDDARDRGLFVVRLRRSTSERTSVVVAAASDGETLLAVRDGTRAARAPICPVEVAVGDAGAVLANFAFSPSEPRRYYLYRGPWGAVFEGSLPAGIADALPDEAGLGGLATSSSLSAAISFDGDVYEWRDAEPRRHRRSGAAQSSSTWVWREHLFWSSYEEEARPYTSRIIHVGPDGIETVVIDGVATGTAIYSFQTDGTTMAWWRVTSRARDGTITEGEIVTSPFATRAEDVVERVVRRLPGSIHFRLGGGAVAYGYAHTEGGTIVERRLDIVDLASGALSRVSFPADASPRWGLTDRPAWVSADEVAVPARPFGGGTATMLRIARSAFVPVP